MKREQTVTVTNSRGLHARASAKFVTAVAQLPEGARISVQRDGSSVDGTSIMGLMMLGAARGDTITIVAEGVEAEAALASLVELVENRFGEE